MKSKITLLLLVLLAFGCKGKAKEAQEVLVKINNDAITLEEFEREYRTERKGYTPAYPAGRENVLKLKAAYLNQMIEEKLILNEAARRGVSLSAEEVNAAIAEIKKDYADEKSFEKMLVNEYINIDRWKEKIKEKLLIDKIISQLVLSKISVSDGEVEQFYNDNIDEYKREEEVKARQILLATEEDAEKARERIRSGEDFADVAEEISLSPDSKEGGDLGYFSRGIMPPEFDDVVFTIEKGMISEVVRSPYGYHVFLVEDKREARDLGIDEVKGKIVEILKREKMEEAYLNWMEKLKSGVKIDVNRETLRKSIGIR